MANAGARVLARGIAVALPIFALAEINYPQLQPQSQLAIFAGLGLALCFLAKGRVVDLAAAGLALAVCGFVVVQTEPWFRGLWLDSTALGERAGVETGWDIAIGTVGIVLVLLATQRVVGWVLPALAGAFLLYAKLGPMLPDWLMPHRGYSLERIVGQAFLHSQGVFGIALRVMFTYVFLFVVFGAILEATGATGFIVNLARRVFARSTGGAAKVAVFSSGLMGSLSGSAVANTATTGTFTIPMMRSSGFPRHEAAGVEAAASSGGALVPPVMGAGAYMMLEIVTPAVTYLEIIRAAFLPALVYYASLFVIVHLSARKFQGREAGATPAGIGADGVGAAATAEPAPTGAAAPGSGEAEPFSWARFEGLVFLGGLGGLIVFLLAGFSVFRAVTLALLVVVFLSAWNRRTRLGVGRLLAALERAAEASTALVAAAACVGIVIGIVTLTGIGTRLPALILPLAQDHLILALLAIMVSSIVLGMGLPSAVCYLLMATLIGPVLAKLGVVPLAAHLFIFYFGMMSMVTPPVALAAYAASSIANASFLKSSWAAFRFALVGFGLPFLFVFRPALLMLEPDGSRAPWPAVAVALAIALAGVVPLAAAITGQLWTRLTPATRAVSLAAALLILAPGLARQAMDSSAGIAWWNYLGLAGFAVLAVINRRRRQAQG